MTDTRYWQFDPLDTWFFREARGFEASGSNELASLFPPPANTVAGAVRTLIGDQRGVDWSRFPDADEYRALREQIGDGDHLGQLGLTGPYPLWRGERLYPAPLHLLGKDQDYRLLEPGDPVTCDLGRVRLPRIRQAAAGPLPGAKPLAGSWLTPADLGRVLAGQPPGQVIGANVLYDEEPRLGIARDNARRTGRDGLLYQTRHLRPRAGLAIGFGTRGLAETFLPAPGVMRFGGEGRPGALQAAQPPAALVPPKLQDRRLLLMLLTAADFGQDWVPPGLQPEQRDGVQIWRGTLAGVALTLECAVLGKAAREGGWDLARERPRPVRSLIPAGSVYFCTLEGDMPPHIASKALQGQFIGQDTALGRGELAVGAW
jgi:CRISPR-associated protein Cmr3